MTMLMLTLLRHAKAEPGGPGMADEFRKLSDRGRVDAAKMGRHMAERGVRPDLILCSSSVRTRETCDLVRPFLAPDAVLAVEPGLYLAESYALQDRVKRIAAGPPRHVHRT